MRVHLTGRDRLIPALPSAASVRYRLRQGLAAISPRVPADRDAILRRTLTPTQTAAFLALSAHDQAHLLRVYRLLATDGASDDLLVAALLHDVAKVGPEGRVRLPDRVIRVVLRRLAPRMLARLARLPARGLLVGLKLAVHHPALGAARARALGCSERTCWLIAHHEAVSADDPELRRLIVADHAGA